MHDFFFACFNRIVLRMAKIPWRFGYSECNRDNYHTIGTYPKIFIATCAMCKFAIATCNVQNISESQKNAIPDPSLQSSLMHFWQIQ